MFPGIYPIIYDNEYLTYNLVSLRSVTWKDKLSKLERLVSKEEAIRKVIAAERSIENIGFPKLVKSNCLPMDFPRGGILFNCPPKKYIESWWDIYPNLKNNNPEEQISFILSKTEEIVIRENSNFANCFMIKHERVYQKENDNIPHGQNATLYIFPEDGRRGVLFFVSKICKSTIPFDLMRVELRLPAGLEKQFFELYEKNLNDISTQD